jgi:hypothetical protein
MSYLERYTNGEYEPVWDELQVLGSAVRQEPLYSDALAVARETMRRTRQTIEELIQRLIRIGFVFGYDHHLMRLVSRDPGYSYRWATYVEVLAWVREQPPFLLPANLMEEELANDLNYVLDFDEDAFRREWRADPMKPPVMPDYLGELERDFGPVPLSIRAWYEEVGAVNFYGYHPRWPPMVLCDPLQVFALDQQWRKHVRPTSEGGQVFAFAEDQFFKANVSGADTEYAFHLPDARADARLFYWAPFPRGGPLTFVEYLRWSLLHWAGFTVGTGQWVVHNHCGPGGNGEGF